ncbi:MAG TPA: hypothetical protein VKA86_01375 [Candidatus Krumholzibacteria bacterium]|nr:hypothetical protein [Candidatus Krumholzibacteria bacterium]
MKRTPIPMLPLFALVLGLVLSGCSDDTSGPLSSGDDDVSGTQTLETLDLDQEYGGLAYTDEAEGFGDAALVSAAVVEDEAALAEDDEDSLTDRDPSLADPRMRRTFVRILWGQLDGEFDRETVSATPEAGLDWSGSLKVTDGVIALKRTILFERPFDHRLPRVERDSLAWVSRTGPHYDGVLVCVMSRVEDGVAPGELILETPLFRTSLTIDTLDGTERIVAVDDVGNAVSIQAHVQDQRFCGEGFVTGFWKGVEDRPETDAIEMGAFRGRYVGRSGSTTGFLMGLYGLDSQGERVMIGKYIGRGGRVKGLIRGTWDPGTSGDGMGTFQARWVNRNGLHLGTVQGRYLENDANEPGDGFFEGRYEEICSTAP